MKSYMKSAFALSALLVSFSTQAVDVSPHYKVGFDTGGDTLVTVVFTNGEQEKIKSNEGLFFGGGISIVNNAKTVESEIAITYKVWDISASNGDVTWSRWPIDALMFYRWDHVRFGGGFTYHVNPELDGSGVASGLNVEFENALGFVAQIDWRITERMNLGLRYTNLEYELKNSSSAASANGMGLVFSGSF